jgi:glycosyltransferase
MKISIITVCFNSVETIEDTIKSVLSQQHDSLEYIIVDGGSIDGTLDIINKYKDKIYKIVSEPDKGIYDAMNKGIKLSTGEVVGILNSDDFYCDNNVLKNISEVFSDNCVDATYGNIEYVERADIKKCIRFWRAGDYRKEKLSSGWIMPHPAFFVRKELYERYGLFNINFRIAADYELMLRFLKKDIKVKYLDQTLVCMREGGFSGNSFKQRLAGWRELKMAWTKNNFSVPPFFITRRILSKIKQYFV